MEALHVLVHDRQPAEVIVGKAVDVLRDVARSPKSQAMIGEVCTSIILPSDPSTPARAAYHAGDVTDPQRWIAYIEARGAPHGVFVVRIESIGGGRS